MATKEEILQNFDPSAIGIDNGNLLGLPFNYDQANIILFGIPWEVTVSYGAGTAAGPQRVLEASRQLDLYDFDYPVTDNPIHRRARCIRVAPLFAKEKAAPFRSRGCCDGHIGGDNGAAFVTPFMSP